MHRTLIVFAIAVAAATGLLAAAPARVSAAEGYDQSATTTYRLDPANGRLRVAVTLRITNRTPDRNDPYPCVNYTSGWFPLPYPGTCQRVTQYYLTSTTAAIETDAVAIKASSGGRTLVVSSAPSNGSYRALTITFPKLYFGKSRTVQLSYVVKGGAPRSQNSTRTLRAYASFCAIANGVDSGSVSVRMPKGFAVSTTGARLKAKVVGTERVFSSGRITTTGDWFACFSGANSAGYRTQQIAAADGRTIQLRSWPEDPAWAKGVLADVATSLPELERLTGTGMTAPAGLRVEESSTGTEYAGFYDGATNTVTVGEDFRQPSLVEHELAHLWFNRSAFRDTWLSEGFAEWAGRAASGEAACADPGTTADPVDLANWKYLQPRATAAEREAVVTQYQAACHVISAVAAAAGQERMTDAVSALLDRRDPYAAIPSGQRVSKVADWRDWLDAMDELALAPAAAPEGLASDLLVRFRIAPDRSLLEARAEARGAYRNLVVTTDGWTVPPAVRVPMASWEFAAAEDAIGAAGQAWQLTGETDQVLPGVDARLGPVAEAWQAATTADDLEKAADLADRQLAAARDVADARTLLAEPLDLAQQVGMFGTRIPSLDAAIPAVRAGDGDTAAGITARVRDAIAGLRATGQQRIVLAGAALLAMVMLLGGLMVRHTRSAARLRAGAAPGTAVATAGAHPWIPNPLDESPTQVWDVSILRSDPDPDLGALVRSPRRSDGAPEVPGNAQPGSGGGSGS